MLSIVSEKTIGILDRKSNFKKQKISTAFEASLFARELYGDDIELYESFFIIILDRGSSVVSYCKISQGGVAGTVVDIKMVAKVAIDSLAYGIIMVHNHPSGQLNPSNEDIKITRKVREALSLFEIDVVDHLILTKDSFYSFAENETL